MSLSKMIERDNWMDPDIWTLYEQSWNEYKAIREAHHLYGSEAAQAKVYLLELILTMNHGKQYLREGEPPRVTMRDVIAYHEMLDRKYRSQNGAE
jgi:hypothetical protein